MTTQASTTTLASDPAAEPRPVLSVAEAAELLGVSESLVLQQIALDTLPRKRCGRHIVFSRERLMEWLNAS